jgi:hypothetical protein
MMPKGDNMSKHKVGKRKSKRTKKQPKCTLCNPFRWLGNTKGRHRHSYYRQQHEMDINHSDSIEF